MSKSNRMYKIFMTSMIVIIAGILLATGIIAIQKQMKLKTSFDYIPGVDVEVFVQNDDNSTETLIFRNFEDTANSKTIKFNATYCELSATTLTMNNNFVTAYGNNFTLIVKNYSDFAIQTELTSTSTAKIGGNSVNAVPAEITPPTAQIEAGKSGEFVVSCEPIIPQTTTISLSFEEVVTGGGSDSGDSTGGNSGGSGSGGSGSGNDDEDGNDVPYTIKTYNTTNITTNYNSAWDGYSYVEFGEYPQTLATETVTLTSGEANKTGAIGTGASGAKYYYQLDVNGYGTAGWYKFEPIRWIIVGAGANYSSKYMPSDAPATAYAGGDGTNTEIGENQVLLLSEFGLYRDYFDKERAMNQFGSNECDVQVSLNGSFAQMAGLKQYFASGATGNYIAKVTPGTTYADSSNNKQFDSTSSYNMFLLGGNIDEDTYQYVNYFDMYSEQAQCVPTAFAKTTGVYYDSSYDASCGWLRSGYYNGNTHAYFVDYDGYVNYFGVSSNELAVRPSFVLNLA